MLLDVPYRRVADVDVAPLLALVDRLRVLWEPPGAALWSAIAERMAFVGKDDRPADVAYRRMNPKGYVQLCLANDEVPRAPWAIDVPDDVLSAAERAAIVADFAERCAAIYGPGTVFLLVVAVLAPGGEIPSHRDLPHDVNKRAWSHRLHVPLTASDTTELTLKGEVVRFDRGGVYEIDNISPHAVRHVGDGFRVSLVADYCPNENLEKRNAPSPPKVKAS